MRTRKAERNAILSARYAHPFKALIAHLVISPKTGRSVPNALFKAPLLRAETADG